MGCNPIGDKPCSPEKPFLFENRNFVMYLVLVTSSFLKLFFLKSIQKVRSKRKATLRKLFLNFLYSKLEVSFQTHPIQNSCWKPKFALSSSLKLSLCETWIQQEFSDLKVFEIHFITLINTCPMRGRGIYSPVCFQAWVPKDMKSSGLE